MIGSRPGARLPFPSVWTLLAANDSQSSTLWHWEQRTHEGALIARSARGFNDYEYCLEDAMLHGYLGASPT